MTPSNKMINTMLFDADGVVIPSDKKFADHLTDDLHITRDMTASFFTGPFKQCLIGKADLKEEIAPHLPQWGWDKSVDEFLDVWFQVEHHLDQRLIAYIQDLRSKGIACYVATNQEKYRSQYMKEYMELGSKFDGVFASNEIGSAKPDTSFFTHILEDLGVAAENVLFWDDTERNIVAAKGMGMQAELYTSFEDFGEKMKDSYI